MARLNRKQAKQFTKLKEEKERHKVHKPTPAVRAIQETIERTTRIFGDWTGDGNFDQFEARSLIVNNAVATELASKGLLLSLQREINRIGLTLNVTNWNWSCIGKRRRHNRISITYVVADTQAHWRVSKSVIDLLLAGIMGNFAYEVTQADLDVIIGQFDEFTDEQLYTMSEFMLDAPIPNTHEEFMTTFMGLNNTTNSMPTLDTLSGDDSSNTDADATSMKETSLQSTDNEVLRKQVTKLEKANRNLKKAASENMERAAKAEQQLDQLQSQHSQLKQSAQSNGQVYLSLQEQLETEKNKTANYEKDYNVLSNRYQDARQQLDTANSRLATLQSDYDNKIQNLNQQINELTKELAASPNADKLNTERTLHDEQSNRPGLNQTRLETIVGVLADKVREYEVAEQQLPSTINRNHQGGSSVSVSPSPQQGTPTPVNESEVAKDVKTYRVVKQPVITHDNEVSRPLSLPANANDELWESFQKMVWNTLSRLSEADNNDIPAAIQEAAQQYMQRIITSIPASQGTDVLTTLVKSPGMPHKLIQALSGALTRTNATNYQPLDSLVRKYYDYTGDERLFQRPIQGHFIANDAVNAEEPLFVDNAGEVHLYGDISFGELERQVDQRYLYSAQENIHSGEITLIKVLRKDFEPSPVNDDEELSELQEILPQLSGKRVFLATWWSVTSIRRRLSQMGVELTALDPSKISEARINDELANDNKYDLRIVSIRGAHHHNVKQGVELRRHDKHVHVMNNPSLSAIINLLKREFA